MDHANCQKCEKPFDSESPRSEESSRFCRECYPWIRLKWGDRYDERGNGQAKLYAVLVVGAVVAFFYWQGLRHDEYLRTTSPEQQAQDRLDMAIEDAQDEGMPRGH